MGLKSSGFFTSLTMGCRVKLVVSWRAIFLLTLLLLTNGCSTISTLSQPVHAGKPLVMSGSRLNITALREHASVKERFGVSPPRYPLLDLPFSALLDMVVLGYTLPVA